LKEVFGQEFVAW